MSQSSFFFQQGENPSFKEETEYKHPDQIIIGENREDFSRGSSSEQEGYRKRRFSINRRSLSPRFLSCLGFLLSFLFGVMVLLGSLPSLFFAVLFLFRNQPLNQTVKKLWKLSSHALVVSAGFALGIISPRLGFGFILLYLSWYAGQDRFSQMIRNLFSVR